MRVDVAIVGGGPAGLAAALTLGRARQQVLLCDEGPRRNAAAERMYNFVSRDGTPPQEFRDIARGQLARYHTVQLRDRRVTRITGSRGAFEVLLGDEAVSARRVLLCTGLIDELPTIPGFADWWGHGIYQCPYCHGWEVQDRVWGCLAQAANAAMVLPFALLLRGWTRDVVVFTNNEFAVPEETRAAFLTAGIRLETAPIARLAGEAGHLTGVELSDGRLVACDTLFAHPPQRQVPVVQQLGVALDDEGYVRIDPMSRETSVPGVCAAGDLTTRMQGALFSAAAGTQAAARLAHELITERVLTREG